MDDEALQVEISNRANKIAAELKSVLLERFAPLLWKKILMDSGHLRKRYSHLRPSKTPEQGVEVNRVYPHNELAWLVRVSSSESGAASAHIHKDVVLQIGKLKGGQQLIELGK